MIVEPPCGKIAAAARVVAPAARRQPRHPGADPDLAEHARHAEVVHAVVGEEALVLRGQDRVTHDRRDVLVLRDLPVLSGELDERLAVGVVDVTDGRKLEPREGPQVGQVRAIEVDVMNGARDGNGDSQKRDDSKRGAGEKNNATTGPT